VHAEALSRAKKYEVSRRHWYEFLVSANSIFGVFEQGAKQGDDGDRDWFKARKQQRKDDPLLSYLHHARNADEHHVASVTELAKPRMVMMAGEEKIAAVEDMVGNKGTFQNLQSGPADLTKVNGIRVYPERAKLIKVTDSSGTYEPPVMHLGEALEENSPSEVAKLMTVYLEAMVADAQTLMK
jgi:hypothetical protein